jgi:hypothetical protein
VEPIQIVNNGPLLLSTTYWGTEPARRGLMLLCGNAGALRLLVPMAAEHNMQEMRTGSSVTIERSQDRERDVDVVFEDGTKSPFFVALHARQMINAGPGAKKLLPFYVYTSNGMPMRFVAKDAR